MPTSARGSCRTGSGFTLVELLVVVLIIGATIGLAAIALDRGADRVDVEARRLRQLMDHAAARARLTGTPLAWQWSGRRYRFLRHGDAWREISGANADEILRPRTLPESMSIRSSGNPQAGRMAIDEQTIVIFPASGLAQSFALTMSNAGEADVTIKGDAGGWISLSRDSN